MSAIAAILSRAAPPDRTTVTRMLAVVPHRGTRTEIHVEGRCAIGVVNPEDRVESSLAQMMGWSAALTGTIDNAAALREELARRGVPVPDASSPAHLLLAAFRTLGEDLLPRLRGLFAIVLSDGERLWCFRDQLGFRLFFYRDDPDGVVVATEAKQVAVGAGISREPDAEVVEHIFYGDYDDDTPAALKGVRRLPKGSLLTADRDRTRRRVYWHPTDYLEIAPPAPRDVPEVFDGLMRQAATRALGGHDLISLSGGVDSPAVAAYAAPAHLQMVGRPLTAFTAVFPDLPAVDESEYTRAVAEFLRIPLHTYVKAARPLDRLQEWVRVLDGPVPQILITDAEEHFLEARRLGFRTMLTGEVAEFLTDRRGYLTPHLLWRGRFRALWRRIRYQRERGSSRAATIRQLLSTFVPGFLEAALVRRRGYGVDLEIPRWVDARRVNGVAAAYLVPARHRWRRSQLAGFLGPGLSMEANEIVQAVCGLRVRMPWADLDLWEFFLRLPAEMKFPDAWRKGLVRRLLRGKVPDLILDRKGKTVFDDSMLARVDYAELARWLVNPPHRVAGIRYDVLADRLAQQNLSIREFIWAKDLAAIHAFLTA
ncbi:MAG TPA: asparagine synthase-related protein [bacterium]|jgi:asparagine synthase (glutamine-hydrolysing)|nr:asparagine synthase-related protein [bacterium]